MSNIQQGIPKIQCGEVVSQLYIFLYQMSILNPDYAIIGLLGLLKGISDGLSTWSATTGDVIPGEH